MVFWAIYKNEKKKKEMRSMLPYKTQKVLQFEILYICEIVTFGLKFLHKKPYF